MERVLVAVVSRAQGLGGELQLRLETDQPEELFRPGAVLTLDEPPLGLADRLVVERARPHGRGWVVKFEGLDSRSLAERYAGRRLLVLRDALPALAEGEFFLHDLVGLEVRDESNGSVGTVTAVYDAAGSPLLAVRGGEREHLIPFGREFVSRVDREAGIVWIEPPAGLLDL
jgi:16S rRNA processing protein RimM